MLASMSLCLPLMAFSLLLMVCSICGMASAGGAGGHRGGGGGEVPVVGVGPQGRMVGAGPALVLGGGGWDQGGPY